MAILNALGVPSNAQIQSDETQIGQVEDEVVDRIMTGLQTALGGPVNQVVSQLIDEIGQKVVAPVTAQLGAFNENFARLQESLAKVENMLQSGFVVAPKLEGKD